MHKTTCLKNGLKIVTLKMPTMKSAAIGVWISVGGRHETRANRGVSHFLEHLVFKGTKRRSALEIKNTIEGMGGILNAFTNDEMTCYLARVMGSQVPHALNVLGDMTMNPLLGKKDIDRERMVILEELKMYHDLPDQYVHELLGGIFWPGHIIGMPLIGTPRSLKRLTRPVLMEYCGRNYTPSNITVVACGDVNDKAVVDECRKVFRAKGRSGKPVSERIRTKQNGPNSVFYGKKTEQTHIAMGFHGPDRSSEERYAMNLLNIIMGANMSSRLFHEVREERGLAYAIGSHIRFYEDDGAFVIDAGIDNRRTVESVSVILNELTKLKKGPVTRDEWRRAKEYYLGHLAFIMEQTASRMTWLGERIVTESDVIEPREVVRRIRSITIDEIISLGRRIFDAKNLSMALVGPVKKADERTIKDMIGAFK